MGKQDLIVAGLTALLSISESLPFVRKTKYNGIIQAVLGAFKTIYESIKLAK